MDKEKDSGESRQIRELRKQIIRLKRELAHARKQNHRALEAYEEATAEPSDYKKEPQGVDKCPKCKGKDVKQLTLKDILFYFCRDCGAKGKADGLKEKKQ